MLSYQEEDAIETGTGLGEENKFFSDYRMGPYVDQIQIVFFPTMEQRKKPKGFKKRILPID